MSFTTLLTWLTPVADALQSDDGPAALDKAGDLLKKAAEAVRNAQTLFRGTADGATAPGPDEAHAEKECEAVLARCHAAATAPRAAAGDAAGLDPATILSLIQVFQTVMGLIRKRRKPAAA